MFHCGILSVPPIVSQWNTSIIIMVNIFKQTRLEKKLLISDVVEKLCYPSDVIEALESDKIDFLPKPYNYYFAKNYAHFLKLDNIPYLLKKYR
jgi:cytoskeletal protein RodZ